jgi:hypothetical protein
MSYPEAFEATGVSRRYLRPVPAVPPFPCVSAVSRSVE